ncbi:MAG: hypothetical protein METHP_00887 [Methanoregula sp. SKADARSKE-2]|nr:MAG: hypothetical protein METHP_00887 [Methanoregula sp. SKADARSKE-2]
MTDLFATLSASDKRRNLMILLKTGPNDGCTIEELGVTSANMIPLIRIREEAHLITQSGSIYSLMLIGLALATRMDKLTRMAEFFEKRSCLLV